jgi:Protein of unknown function (DUF1549)/Protein of unknown function (DUF1553)
MKRHPATSRSKAAIAIVCGLAAAGGAAMALRAQSLNDLTPQLPVSDPTCPWFENAAQGMASQTASLSQLNPASRASTGARSLTKLTAQVAAQLPPVPGGGRTGAAADLANAGLIDGYIFSALQSAGVQPADPTTDWEFIRRVTLDLDGRIPNPSDVLAFVADATPAKRAALVDKLIASPLWIDKWTMYFGDLLKNNSSNSQINRFRPGVQAFYNYIKASLAANKPYDQMTRELIVAQGANSYNTGEINFNVGGVVTGGPVQDVWDQQLANIADTYLGIAHQNCLLCHNGAGHLTTLSLWGGQQTRVAAWSMAAFMAQTYTYSTAVSSAATTPRYWTVEDGTKYTGNYPLNTTTGNRPPRQPIGTVKTISPAYIFTGETPKSGENYRAALARIVTADPQFARATVNYMWAYFFGVGLVDPPDQFDPLRLDPDNPPPASSGFTLQPSNPRLLNALTNAFIANKYDLQWLMRQIANSRAYQLSARYDGTWNDSWDTLYARKLVRRLWGEEVHDALATSSSITPSYNIATYGTISYAMQFPEPVAIPDGASGNVSGFLDSFLRGNRDDQPRNEAGSILQTLNLMNDSLVLNRTSPTGPAGSLLASNINLTNTQLVNNLFLAVLSRYPTSQELTTALGNLSNAPTRQAEAQNLLWSLYNKVDFIFNY